MNKVTKQLFAAIEADDEPAALAAIAAGAALDAEKRGSPPLKLAAARGLARVVQALLEAGVDVHRPDDVWEPVQSAAMYARIDVLRLLLDAGAKPDRQTLGGSALAAAVHGRHPQCAAALELLVAHGAVLSEDLMRQALAHKNDAAAAYLSAAGIPGAPAAPKARGAAQAPPAKKKGARGRKPTRARRESDPWKRAFIHRDWQIAEAAGDPAAGDPPAGDPPADEPEYASRIRHSYEVLAHAADTAPRALTLDELPFQRKFGTKSDHSTLGVAWGLLRKLRGSLGLTGVDADGEVELVGHEEWSDGMRAGLKLNRCYAGKRQGQRAHILDLSLAVFDLQGHLLCWTRDLDQEQTAKTLVTFYRRKDEAHVTLTPEQLRRLNEQAAPKR